MQSGTVVYPRSQLGELPFDASWVRGSRYVGTLPPVQSVEFSFTRIEVGPETGRGSTRRRAWSIHRALGQDEAVIES